MNNFKYPISWAITLKEEHTNGKVTVRRDNIISLEREIQGAVNLKHTVIVNFSIFYLYRLIWKNLIQYHLYFDMLFSYYSFLC